MSVGVELDPSTIERLARVHPGWFAFYASGGEWRPSAHHRLVMDKLADVAAGRTKRLLISMPPGHGKSWACDRYFPAWYAGAYPGRRVLLASHSSGYARTWGAQARNVLQRVGPVLFGVAPPQNAAEASWETWDYRGDVPRNTEGGMKTCGVGERIAGRRGHVLIVDDPFGKKEDAWSATIREKVWGWFNADLMTRVFPSSGIVVIHTRWHTDDLIGKLLAEQEEGGDKWEVINLPAICEDPATDLLGRAYGEALWPGLWPKHLVELQKRRGVYVWESLFQCRPRPLSGGVFKREWIRYATWIEFGVSVLYAAGGRLHRVNLADCVLFGIADLATSTKEQADYTAVGAFAVTAGGVVLVLQVKHARLKGPEHLELLETFFDLWNLSVMWVESVGYQLSAVQHARKAGLAVRELSPGGMSKEARAISATATLEGERMFFLPGDWRAGCEGELIDFPRGTHDDQVDLIAYAARLAPKIAKSYRRGAARMGGAGRGRLTRRAHDR